MISKYSIAFTLIVVIMIQSLQSFAQETVSSSDQWTFLGDRRADYALDHDDLLINEGSEHIMALKFIIRQGTLTMHRCTVYFVDGDTKDIEFLDEVKYDENGITIIIPDNNKIVYKVSFWYDTQDNSDKKSIVEVWAMNQSPVLK